MIDGENELFELCINAGIGEDDFDAVDNGARHHIENQLQMELEDYLWERKQEYLREEGNMYVDKVKRLLREDDVA